MSKWTDGIEEAGGEPCSKCEKWRTLYDGYIEDCPQCGDGGYDIYSLEAIKQIMEKAE